MISSLFPLSSWRETVWKAKVRRTTLILTSGLLATQTEGCGHYIDNDEYRALIQVFPQRFPERILAGLFGACFVRRI